VTINNQSYYMYILLLQVQMRCFFFCQNLLVGHAAFIFKN